MTNKDLPINNPQGLIIQGARLWIPSHPKAESDGILHGHTLVVANKKIEQIIEESELLSDQDKYQNWHSYQRLQLKGELITPGLIDCHTHLVFAGDRAHEWQRRLAGESYQEIVKTGGGIQTTVNATRTSNIDTLLALSKPRLQSLINEGVTTIEIKSGYGLDYENERKQLDVIKQLKHDFPIDISPTLLAAHTIPQAYQDDPDAYLSLIIDNMLPDFWQDQLFESVDIFCETIAFTLEHAKRLFHAAKQLGIPIKAHAEQLSHLGTSQLVAEQGGLSVDHIEYLQESDAIAMQQSKTVATLLPIAFYFLKETKVPPIQLLRDHNIPIAVATDFNPGTAPIASLRLAMNMAAVFFGLTVEEILLGVTEYAAAALGRSHSHGKLAVGFTANLAVWNVEKPVEIFYELGKNPLRFRVFEGSVFKNSVAQSDINTQ